MRQYALIRLKPGKRMPLMGEFCDTYHRLMNQAGAWAIAQQYYNHNLRHGLRFPMPPKTGERFVRAMPDFEITEIGRWEGK